MQEQLFSALVFIVGVILLASIRKIASVYIGKQKRLYIHMGDHTPSNYLDSSWYELYIYLMIIMTSCLLIAFGISGMM